MSNGSNEGGGPPFGEEDLANLRAFFDLYDQLYDRIQEVTLKKAHTIPDFAEVLRALTQEQLETQSESSRRLLRDAFEDGRWGPYLEDLQRQGRTYASMGVNFAAWFELTGAFRAVLIPHIIQSAGAEPGSFQAALLGMERFLDLALSEIGGAYLQTKQELIEQQQQVLLELSTPVLQIRDRMLLVPIVGVIDTRRARQLTAHLLRTIRAVRAQWVVMDITGVPAVDSKVANHLLQTVHAARLMGAHPILTGISPEVAQTLVALGVQLGELATTGELQAGIELAERMRRQLDALPSGGDRGG